MRIWARFSKAGPAIFLSHLDLVRTMERSARRANLPIAFSEGYHPHPRISFGPALPLGVSSDGEYLEVELLHDMDVNEFIQRMRGALPAGIDILSASEVPGHIRSLNSLIDTASYTVTVRYKRKGGRSSFQDGPDTSSPSSGDEGYASNRTTLSRAESEGDSTFPLEILERGLASLLRLPEFPIEREGRDEKKRKIDIAKLMKGFKVLEFRSEFFLLEMVLAVGGGGSARPEDVMIALSLMIEPIEFEIIKVHRNELYITTRDGRISPIEYALTIS